MPNPKGKCVYHLVTDKKEKERFDKNYPQLLRVFLERSIKIANNDKDFFDRVFFSEVK